MEWDEQERWDFMKASRQHEGQTRLHKADFFACRIGQRLQGVDVVKRLEVPRQKALSGLFGLLRGLGALGEELALGFEPVLMFVAVDALRATLFSDEVGAQGHVFVGVRRRRGRRGCLGLGGALGLHRSGSLGRFGYGLGLGSGGLYSALCGRGCSRSRWSSRGGHHGFAISFVFLGHNLGLFLEIAPG